MGDLTGRCIHECRVRWRLAHATAPVQRTMIGKQGMRVALGWCSWGIDDLPLGQGVAPRGDDIGIQAPIIGVEFGCAQGSAHTARHRAPLKVGNCSRASWLT